MMRGCSQACAEHQVCQGALTSAAERAHTPFNMLPPPCVQVLFLQEAISGTASEFRQPTGEGAPTGQARLPEWCLVNGVWSLFLAFGLVLTALLTRQVDMDAYAVLPVPLRHCVGSCSGTHVLLTGRLLPSFAAT